MVQTSATANIDETVIIKGKVSVGENTYIAPGVIINAPHGSIKIGANTVIMENAIIRSSAKFDCKIGDNVLIGPKACITGATIHNACFIATNATIFHGSEILSGSVVAVDGIVHIGTWCPENTYIKINHVAFGNPAVIYAPTEIDALHTELRKLGFAKYVYDMDVAGMSTSEVYTAMTNLIVERMKKI
jgi:carbonic anhydrase/acetyltransferase-like protein (isoleucine patch superfamily)